MEEAAEVVSGIIESGCEITGGSTVSNFIYTVYDNSEGFALLTQLACISNRFSARQGECYTDVQLAIEYCNENPTDGDCLNYLACDCMMALIAVVRSLSDSGFLNFGNARMLSGREIEQPKGKIRKRQSHSIHRLLQWRPPLPADPQWSTHSLWSKIGCPEEAFDTSLQTQYNGGDTLEYDGLVYEVSK